MNDRKLKVVVENLHDMSAGARISVVFTQENSFLLQMLGITVQKGVAKTMQLERKLAEVEAALKVARRERSAERTGRIRAQRVPIPSPRGTKGKDASIFSDRV